MSGSRKRPLRRLGDLLPGLASQLGIDEELRAARGLSSWQRIVEERVPVASGASDLLEVRPPALIVSADDAATAQELRLHSAPPARYRLAGAPSTRFPAPSYRAIANSGCDPSDPQDRTCHQGRSHGSFQV